MFNPVYAQCVRVKLINGDIEEYGLIVQDNYAQVCDIGYATVEEFVEAYPTRESITDWIGEQELFSDSLYKLSDLMTGEDWNNGVKAVTLEGYPSQKVKPALTKKCARANKVKTNK